MTSWQHWVTVGAALLAAGALSAPALAASPLTLTVQTTLNANGSVTYDGTLTNVVTSPHLSDLKIAWVVLTPSQYAEFAAGNHDVGTVVHSDDVHEYLTGTTMTNLTYKTNPKNFKGDYEAVIEYKNAKGISSPPTLNEARTAEVTGESNAVSLTYPPAGQMPEVPIASGLPLIGLAVGGALWLRSRKVSQAVPSRR